MTQSKEKYLEELSKLDASVLERLVELSKYQEIQKIFSNPLLFAGLKVKLKSAGLLK